MTPERWQRAKELFDAALGQAPAERTAFVERASGGDVELRDELRRLLGQHQAAEAEAFIDPTLTRGSGTPADDGGRAWEGRQLGPYRILERIGRGGMGAVHRALRDADGLRQQVAIKLIGRWADSEAVRTRFRDERRILARLEHPNIARFIDAGTTDEGLPYLVMEYVEGRPITAFADGRRLGVRERLALFRIVCAAVHYAHQSLIVHRDLKPGNVLVTEAGTPKLLDFGIAKLLEAEPGADTLTVTMLRPFTPDYASPEQVRGEAITTATDVYSLGLVLYELLTGERPQRVASLDPEEIARIVCHQPVPAPSTAVRRAATQPQGSAKPPAGGPPRTPRLRRELRGDLDTIVLTALRKEPERRYRSVDQLSEDVQRYLDGRPILARPESFGYHSLKFMQRHRLAMGAAALLALSLIGGVAATLRQARHAEEQRRRAERRFNDVRALASAMIFEVHDAIRNLPGATPARQVLIAKALAYVDGLARESGHDRGLQRELAAAYQRLGEVQGGAVGGNLGDTLGALASYEKALALRRRLASAPDGEAADVEALAQLEFQLGSLLRVMGRFAQAERTLQDCARRLAELSGSPGDVRDRLAAAYQRLAEVQARQGQEAESLESARRAVEHGQAFLASRPGDQSAGANLALALYELAERLASAGRPAEALAHTRRARELQEALLRGRPSNTAYRRGLLYSLNGEGRHLAALGQQAGALRVYRRAVEVASEMLSADPRDRWSQLAVGIAQRALGSGLVRAGERTQGIGALRAAHATVARVVGEDPASSFARDELAGIQRRLGDALWSSGSARDLREACAVLEHARSIWNALRDENGLPADSAAVLPGLDAQLARCPRVG